MSLARSLGLSFEESRRQVETQQTRRRGLGSPSSLRKKEVGKKGPEFHRAEGKLEKAKGTEALGTF